MELKERDKLNEAIVLVKGTRENLILLENIKQGQIPVSICPILEGALEKAVDLICEVLDTDAGNKQEKG